MTDDYTVASLISVKCHVSEISMSILT